MQQISERNKNPSSFIITTIFDHIHKVCLWYTIINKGNDVSLACQEFVPIVSVILCQPILSTLRLS